MVMHWQYVSMCRGGHSVIERLRAEGINSDDYISFFGLRSYDKFDGSASEQSPAKDSEQSSTKESEQSSIKDSEQSSTKVPPSMHSRLLQQENLDPFSPVDTLVGPPFTAVPNEDRVKVEDNVTSPLTQTVTEKASHSSLESKPKNQSQTSVPDTIETTATSADGESARVKKRGTHKPRESTTTVAPTDGRDLYVTEELYIHSKLLIVDDRIVICGSGKLF